MKHNHSKCKHVLSFCEQCDVVSCEKCVMEWKKNNYAYTPYTLNSTYTPSGGTPSFTRAMPINNNVTNPNHKHE